jgi:pimeloyl-ACP methyl ester carboxylesterase
LADGRSDPNQGFASILVTPPDGPTLHVRSYGSRFASALPVVCLPGLARTAADFHPLAAALAADPAKPRHVLALDYRGHGQSKYDRNPNNYALPVALADLSAVLTELKIAPATFIGTSYGGLLAMMLAVSRPAAIAGVILNDIGPVIEPEGLLRLKLRIEGLGESSPSRGTLGRARKSCAGCSTRSSRSSHRRIGSRLPTALGASAATDLCPTLIRRSPERC